MSSRFGIRACWEEKGKLLHCILATETGRGICFSVQWKRSECLYHVGMQNTGDGSRYGPNASAELEA